MITSKNPLISVLIPAYNSAKFIDRAIKSILNQEYDNWEIIIVDDGSTDSTGLIVDGYTKSHDRITTIHQQNRGYIYTNNFLATKATGEYVLFLDSDNWLESNDVLSKAVEAIILYSVDVVCLPCSYIFENKKQPHKVLPILKEDCLCNDYHAVSEAIKSGTIFVHTHGGKIIKRTLLDGLQLSGCPTGADSRFFSAILARSNTVYCLSKPSMFVEVRPHSLSDVRYDSLFYLGWIKESENDFWVYYEEKRKKQNIIFYQLSLLLKMYVDYIFSPDRTKDGLRYCSKLFWSNRPLFHAVYPNIKFWLLCRHYNLYRCFYKIINSNKES